MKGKSFTKLIIIQITGKSNIEIQKLEKITTIWKAVVRKQEKHCIFGLAFPTLEQIPWKNRVLDA